MGKEVEVKSSSRDTGNEKPNYLDPNYKGEELPDDLANGPIENRKCTDMLCCLIFVAFIIAWLVCGFYGFSHGNPSLLTHPFDSANNQCGLSGTEAVYYPYLYFPFPFGDTLKYRVCLKTCPSQGDTTTDCLPNVNVTDCHFYWSEFSNSSVYAAKTQGIYGSEGFLKRFCLPTGNLTLITQSGTTTQLADNMYNEVNGQINLELMTQWIGDVWTCWEVMFIVATFAIVISGVYLFLLRYFIGFMVWLSIILTFFAILLLAIFLQWSGINQYPHDPDTQKTLKILAYITYAISGLFLIYIIFMYNRIRLAIAIMKTGVSFVKDTPLSLLIPPVFFVLTVLLYIYWTLAIIYLWSFGDVQNAGGDNPIPKINWTSTTRNAIYFEFFGMLWVNSAFIAFEQFILASTVCIWYFSVGSDSGPQRPISRSIWWAFFYHFGSLAFGSFILALIWAIKYILVYISAKLKVIDQSGKNRCLQCLLGCLMCIVNCVERFIKFLNKNAYIHMALHSTSFCTSAREAFFLILRNALRFLTLGSIGHVFQLLGKGIIAISSAYFGYLILTHPSKWENEIHSPVFPTIVFLMIAFVIAELFMSVYGMACDAILYCYLVDEEICKRNGRAPIHAPETLATFLEDERKENEQKGCCGC